MKSNLRRRPATLLSLAFAMTAAGCGADAGTDPSDEALGTYQAPLVTSWLQVQDLYPVAAGAAVELDLPLPKNSFDVPEPYLDWVHWGRTDATSVNRQRGVLGLVPTYTKIGSGTITRKTTNAPSFRWYAGSPTKLNDQGTNGGLAVSGSGNGFQVAVPVQADIVYCHFYGQTFGAAGSMTVSMSDNSVTPVTTNVPTGQAFDATIGFSGKATAKLNVAFKNKTSSGTFVLNATQCGHAFTSPIGLSIDAVTNGEPYYLGIDGNPRTLHATVFIDNFVKMAFYRDGSKISEDTSAPFEASTPLVPGYHFFQVVATRPDGTTYTSSTMRVPVWAGLPTSATSTIPDNDPKGVKQGIDINNVPSGLKVIDTRFSAHITHSWDADLKLQVIAPDGTTVVLADGLGGNGDNYEASFWDSAETPITSGAAPFPGLYKPQNPLSAFKGKSPNGTWSMQVIDHAAGDVGQWLWKNIYVLPD